MKTKLILIFLCVLAVQLQAQNLIQNPGFELGAIPTGLDQVDYATGWSRDCGLCRACNGGTYPGTPELFDRRSADCRLNVPNGFRHHNLEERTGGNRYVALLRGIVGWSCPNNDGIPYYRETVKGTLSQPLSLHTCSYNVSLYAASQHTTGMTNACGNTTYNILPNDNMIQVVLRKDDNCINELVVFQTNAIVTPSWVVFSGTFQLTQSQAEYGYNRVEFRMVPRPYLPVGTSYNYSSYVLLDDVSISVNPGAPISSNFTLNASNPASSLTNYLVTASVASVPAGSSFYWEVSEVNLTTGVDIPGTLMVNPSNWWHSSLVLVNTFPGYCCNTVPISGNGTFALGHKYRVRRGVWSPCNEWRETTKTVYMNTNGMAPFVEDEGEVDMDLHRYQTRLATIGRGNALPVWDVDVYPNPTRNNVDVRVSRVPGLGQLVLSVYSVNGDELLREYMAGSEFKLDLTGFGPGIYLFRCSDGVQQRVKRVVVTE